MIGAGRDDLLIDQTHSLAWDGEPDRTPDLLGIDHVVDPDHTPVEPDQGSARVAWVDQRIGLDHVVDWHLVRRQHRPVQTTHDAECQAAFKSVRTADRHDLLSFSDVRKGSKRQGSGRLSSDREERHVRALVTQSDRSFVLGVVIEAYA